MTIDKIVEYVLHTPLNTNKAILISMLKELIITNGGTVNPDNPDEPGTSGDIIYDGGMEI
jgi:hypothetical protein